MDPFLFLYPVCWRQNWVSAPQMRVPGEGERVSSTYSPETALRPAGKAVSQEPEIDNLEGFQSPCDSITQLQRYLVLLGCNT